MILFRGPNNYLIQETFQLIGLFSPLSVDRNYLRGFEKAISQFNIGKELYMIIDLHLHTTCSDGTASPLETLQQAAAAGIHLISICDHNTTSAYDELKMHPVNYPVQLIVGTEIDSTWKNQNFHILAYGFHLKEISLQQMLSDNRNKLEQMSTDLIRKMEKDYPEISFSEYESFQRDPSHGGWKGIDYLRSKGLGGIYPECMNYYKKYEIMTPAYPSPEKVCDTIHRAGGKAVLAHPWSRLTQEEEAFFAQLKEWTAMGIDGIECLYPDHSKLLRDQLIDFCHKNHLIVTGGSDSHGEFAKNVDGITYQIGWEQYELPNTETPFLLDSIL